MDKILSARVDEAIIQKIGVLARKLNTSKKAVIEAAIEQYSHQTGLGDSDDIIESTCGAWSRSETSQQSVVEARSAFNESMQRHHQ